MELFELLAKLTLDSNEYKSALQEAESDASSLDDIEANLDLDLSDFEGKVSEAENTVVDDPADPHLGLDDDPFQQVVDDAEGTDVADPDTPKLDLDDDPFQDTVDDAESTDVADPEPPQLDLDTDPYKESLDQAESDTITWQEVVKQVFEALGDVLITAGVVGAIEGVVSGLTEAVDLARSLGDNIDKSSRAMGLSTDAYQEWSHVLDINGASITDLNRGLLNMRKMMGGGEASKEFTDAMDKLGLSTKVANGEITTTEELLVASMKALADFSGPDADRGYLAQAIFGRGGNKLNAMFDGTSEDIDFLIQQAHELGLVMTEEEVANAAAYNDSLTNLNASFEAFKTSLVTGILPALTDVFNMAAKIIAVFNWRTGDAPLEKQFEMIDKGLAGDVLSIDKTQSAAMGLYDKLIAMGDATKLTAEQSAVWKATANELINLIPSLSGVIDTDKMSISQNREEVEALTRAWANNAKQRAINNALQEREDALAEKTQKWIEAQVEANTKSADAGAEWVQTLKAINALRAERGWTPVGEDYTFEEFQQWRNDYLSQYKGIDIRRNAKAGKEVSDWSDVTKDFDLLASAADDAQSKADSLQAEVEEYAAENEQFASGIAEVLGVAASSADGAATSVEGVGTAIKNLPENKTITIDVVTNWGGMTLFPQAKGDWNVPYDNYPSLLHRGERVLTASQARQMDSASGSGIDLAGLAGTIEGAVRAGMKDARVSAYLGERDVTDAINRETRQQLKARRFRG